jgi:lipopolysaccharide transport system ATP-binding protein
MSEAWAVRVAGLSKRYRLGARAEENETLASIPMRLLNAPLRNYRRQRSLIEFEDEERDDTIWALRDIDFELAEGEVLGVVGRNGAGKSTLLKILSRTIRPTAGLAELRGRTASLLEVGTGFHGDLTGRENVFLNGAILGMRRHEIERRFDEIVSFAGIDAFIDTPVKRYSSGMYLRLAFAVAAHLDSDILIADEVLAVGDAEFQRRCLNKMQDVASSGRTVIFVSHNIAAVANLCTRAIWLDAGRVRDEGTVDAVLSAYLGSIRQGNDSSLRDRVDRSGNGSARITSLSFFDAAGQPRTSVTSGEPLEMRLGYELLAEPRRSLHASIGLTSALGDRVGLMSSLYSGESFDQLPQKGEFRCLIPRLNLNTGEYVCRAAVVIDGEKGDSILDAAVLAVEAVDYYGTRSHPPPVAGPVLLDYEWSVSSANSVVSDVESVGGASLES